MRGIDIFVEIAKKICLFDPRIQIYIVGDNKVNYGSNEIPKGGFGEWAQQELKEFRDNGRVIFDREKLVRSISISCRKRPVKSDQIELVANSIQRRLESSGETEIPTKVIGELVMDALKELDRVAYLRFASVYKDFQETDDFRKFIDKNLNLKNE